MNIKQLRYFVLLAEQEHMSATADFLNIAQPTLSKSIASLEEEIGSPLFERHGNHIHLNDYGRQFLPYAKQLLEDLETGLQVIHQKKYDTLGVIHITCHAFADLISSCVLEYTSLNPGVNIELYQSDGGDERLTKDTDFLMESGRHRDRGETWEALPIITEEYKLQASPRCINYPEGTTEVDLIDFKDIPFIAQPYEKYFFRDQVFILCNSRGFTPNIFMRTDDFLTSSKVVNSGQAVRISPASCAALSQKLYPEIKSYGIKDFDTKRTVYLLHHPEDQMTEVAKDFLEFAKNYYGELSKS